MNAIYLERGLTLTSAITGQSYSFTDDASKAAALEQLKKDDKTFLEGKNNNV
jgi:hypothetical protein